MPRRERASPRASSCVPLPEPSIPSSTMNFPRAGIRLKPSVARGNCRHPDGKGCAWSSRRRAQPGWPTVSKGLPTIPSHGSGHRGPPGAWGNHQGGSKTLGDIAHMRLGVSALAIIHPRRLGSSRITRLFGFDGVFLDVLYVNGAARCVERAGYPDLLTLEASGPSLVVELVPEFVRFVAQNKLAAVLPNGSADCWSGGEAFGRFDCRPGAPGALAARQRTTTVAESRLFVFIATSP